jgi:hypothetical protein
LGHPKVVNGTAEQEQVSVFNGEAICVVADEFRLDEQAFCWLRLHAHLTSSVIMVTALTRAL